MYVYSIEELSTIVPSHHFNHPKLLGNSALNIEEILNILAEFTILSSPQHRPDFLEKTLGFTDKST